MSVDFNQIPTNTIKSCSIKTYIGPREGTLKSPLWLGVKYSENVSAILNLTL